MQCQGCGVDVAGYANCPVCGVALRKISGPRLPDEPWELTAPESHVLRYGLGNHAESMAGFKLALTELVARQALTLQGAWVRRGWAPGRYPTFLLCDGPRKAEVEERSLLPVLALHTRVTDRRPRRGVPFDDPEGAVGGVLLPRFVAVAARRDGGYRRYMERDVAGSLRERKLLSAVNARTPAGALASEQLDAWLDVTRRSLFSWSHDQAWLRAYVSGAGSAVFIAQLATPGSPVLKHIGNAMASCASSDPTYAAAWWESGGLDFAGLVDSVSGTFDAVDAGFVGVGGGGGDGGGGGGG